jgi:hypothetical protein
MCQSHLEQGRGSIGCLICLVHIDGARMGSSFQFDPAFPFEYCTALGSYLAKIAHSKKQVSNRWAAGLSLSKRIQAHFGNSFSHSSDHGLVWETLTDRPLLVQPKHPAGQRTTSATCVAVPSLQRLTRAHVRSELGPWQQQLWPYSPIA